MGGEEMLACVLTMTLAMVAAGQEDNLLANPGFEGGVTAEGIPEGGWYRAYGDANSRWVLQTGGAHSGEKCLRLEAPTIPAHNPSVTIEQAVPVTPGRSYALRAWVRGTPGAEGLLAIVWLTADRRWVSHTGQSFRYSDEWTAKRLVGVAPQGAALGVARVDLRQPGTAWVDDVYLAERKAQSLRPNIPGGKVTAGQPFLFAVRAVDGEGLPVAGEAVRMTFAAGGDGGLLAGVATGKPMRAVELTTDVRGEASVRVRPSSRPGLTDAITVSCGAASLRVELQTAKMGQPTSYGLRPAAIVGSPRQPISVSVQLLGSCGEPVPAAGRRLSFSVDGAGQVTPRQAVTDRNGAAQVTLRLPERVYERTAVVVRDAQGLIGRSDPVIVAPPVRKNLVRIGRSGHFVLPDGEPFLPLGGLYANWVHRVEGGKCGDIAAWSFSDVSDDQLREWFAYLRDNGVNALRAMLRDHTARGTEPMDIIGRANLNLLRRWEHFMQLARPYGIRFLVTLHESWYATYGAYFDREVLEKCVLPYYTAEELATLPPYRARFLVEKRMLESTDDPMTDPDVLACQSDYLRDLIPRLRGNPDIFAYEIENEQPNGFFEWTEYQIRLIRALDPSTPICVSHLGGGLLSADPIPWSEKTSVDFYAYHVYPAAGTTSPEVDYGAAVAVTARYARLGKPAFSGEAFGDEWYKATPEARRLGARDCIWGQLLGGNVGCFFWNTGHEAISEFRLARIIADRAGLLRHRWAAPSVVFDVSHPLSDDRFFQSPEGAAMYRAMGAAARACMRRGVDFGFALSGRGAEGRLMKLSEIDAIAALPQKIVLPDGLEAQYLFCKDGDAFVCYLRNVAEIVPIQQDPKMGWTRARRIVEVKVSIHLPLSASRLEVYDLDDGRQWTVPFERSRPLDLGATDHDLVLVAAE